MAREAVTKSTTCDQSVNEQESSGFTPVIGTGMDTCRIFNQDVLHNTLESKMGSQIKETVRKQRRRCVLIATNNKITFEICN